MTNAIPLGFVQQGKTDCLKYCRNFFYSAFVQSLHGYNLRGWGSWQDRLDRKNTRVQLHQMLSGQDLRRIALALPHTEEKPHFARTSFRVLAPKGRIFATMHPHGTTANLMLGPDEQEMLCSSEPEIFSPLPTKWGAKGATVILLERCDEIPLTAVLRKAWKRAAPVKLWSMLA